MANTLLHECLTTQVTKKQHSLVALRWVVWWVLVEAFKIVGIAFPLQSRLKKTNTKTLVGQIQEMDVDS